MKTILIYSGGLDSTTLLYWLRAEGDEVECLGVDYGQRHRLELSRAQDVCYRLGVRFDVADLAAARDLIAGRSSQTNLSVAVPEGHYADENMKTTVVPNRNMILLSVAVGVAIARGFDRVAYAAHAGDHTIYPDCRPAFAEALDEAVRLADWSVVSLYRPFAAAMTKADIVKLGSRLGVPFAATWSCYKGWENTVDPDGTYRHCGRCGTCVERKEAFRLAEVLDPTRYDDPKFAVEAYT